MRPSEKILERLHSTEKIAIYGAATVADRLFDYLEQLQLTSKVCCFLQTVVGQDQSTMHGIPLLPFNSFDEKDVYILIAVGNETVYAEIENNLKTHSIEDYGDARKLLWDSLDFSDAELSKRKQAVDCYLDSEKNITEYRRAYNITHVTYPYVGNAGDTMLSYCVRHYLAYKTWNIIEVTSPVTVDAIKKINETDALIIGGGGLFLPDTNANDISGWQWPISCDLLDQIKVPIIVYSVGFNYFKGQEISEIFVKSLVTLAGKASFIGLRNNGSIEEIKKLLPETLQSKIKYQPCTTTILSKIINSRSCKKAVKKIAFNMAFDREDRRYGKNKECICREIAGAFCKLSKLGYEMYYVAHCDGDFEFAKYLDNQPDLKYEKINLSYELPDKIIDFYKTIDVVIGMRGHAQMIPFGLGCKIVTLASHNKMKWFLQDVKLEDLFIDINVPADLGDKILDKVMYIETNKSILDARQNLALTELYDLSVSNRKEIDQIIENDLATHNNGDFINENY